MAYEEILTKSTGVSLAANQGLSDEEKLNAITNIGLGNVDNTSDANKPVSTAQQTALNKKVDKVTGKGLSTNDYTDEDKEKLDGITGLTNAQIAAICETGSTGEELEKIMAILNEDGLAYFWQQILAKIDTVKVTKTSQLTNDSGYVTETAEYTDTEIQTIWDGIFT